MYLLATSMMKWSAGMMTWTGWSVNHITQKKKMAQLIGIVKGWQWWIWNRVFPITMYNTCDGVGVSTWGKESNLWADHPYDKRRRKSTQAILRPTWFVPGEGSRLVAHLMGMRLLAIPSNRRRYDCSLVAVEERISIKHALVTWDAMKWEVSRCPGQADARGCQAKCLSQRVMYSILPHIPIITLQMNCKLSLTFCLFKLSLIFLQIQGSQKPRFKIRRCEVQMMKMVKKWKIKWSLHGFLHYYINKIWRMMGMTNTFWLAFKWRILHQAGQ